MQQNGSLQHRQDPTPGAVCVCVLFFFKSVHFLSRLIDVSCRYHWGPDPVLLPSSAFSVRWTGTA